MKIAFIYAGGREERWQAALAGAAPSDFFYGAVELARAGHEVVCLDAPDRNSSPAAALCNLLFSWAMPVRVNGGHIMSVRALLPWLKSADAVVAASTAHANALAFWQRLGGCRGRVVGIHCGMVNHTLPPARRKSSARLMQRQQVVLFADAEREECLRAFELNPENVHVNSFGVDANFWTPGEEKREFVLAVGNDGRRDYHTFLDAVSGVSAPVKIVTARPMPASLPAHVEHLRGSWKQPAVTDAELRDLYRRAKVVVVPLEDSLQPSGQSVALQAMACGCPVVMSRTRGLWTAGDFLDGRELVLVEPGSADGLKAAIEARLDDAVGSAAMGLAARAAVERHGRIDDFAARLGALITN